MSSTAFEPPALKLSICITTFNRAAFIGPTLESILAQATDECEVVVLDGGSTDETEEIISSLARRFSRLRYVRQDANNGFDQDCDRAVELSVGEYCWLMTDDDILKPQAVAAVLQALRQNLSLLIVNVEARDFTMSNVRQARILDFTQDRSYGPEEMDRLVLETASILRYLGCFVIERKIWMMRERTQYYGSVFIHIGVIFQQRLPGVTFVLSEPMICYRMGNTHNWRVVETFMLKLPAVVRTLDLSEPARNKICRAAPWKDSMELLWLRGLGLYSLVEWRNWIRPQARSTRESLAPMLIALLPGALTNMLFVMYFSVTRRRFRGVWDAEAVLQNMRNSRFYFRRWWLFEQKAAQSAATSPSQ